MASGFPAKEGFLLKLGGTVKKFKSRYFRLSGSRLEYHKDSKSDKRLGVIPLVGAKLVNLARSVYDKDFCIGITPSGSKRTYVVGAATDAERKAWYDLLLKHLERQKESIFRKGPKGGILEGYADKFGNKSNKWGQKYLVLNSTHFLYYEDKDSTKPNGELKLSNSVSVEAIEEESAPNTKPPVFVFKVNDNSSKATELKFRLPDEEVRTEWITSIEKAIENVDNNEGNSNTSGSADTKSNNDEDDGFNYSESDTDEKSECSIDSESGESEGENEDNDKSPLLSSVRSPKFSESSNISVSNSNINRSPEVKSSDIPRSNPPPIPFSNFNTNNNNNNAVAADGTNKHTVYVADVRREKDYDRHSETRIIKEGYLKKLGAKVKNWKIRYFRLAGFMLRYYPTKDDTVPAGELHLIGTHIAHEPDTLFGQQFTFSVTQTQGIKRTYYMIAKDKEDMEDWMYVIKDRHRFSPFELPLRLNPKVHVNMQLNPDEKALRAIAVPSGVSSLNVITSSQEKKMSQSTLKAKVSKQKRRFVMDGFGNEQSLKPYLGLAIFTCITFARLLVKIDLDLTYITNRIVAMGFPAIGTESIYRNDMGDVKRFFDIRHKDHYKVYNLCSERKYEHSQFGGRVLEFPFDDHNCPSFDDMAYFCKDVADYLSEDDKNVVCIHCKAGKGRTGLMISVFLLYCGEWRTADEALKYYAFVRTKNQKGVTIPSQIRWVHYFEKYITLSRDGLTLPRPRRVWLKKMYFSKTAPGFEYFISRSHGVELTSKEFKIKMSKNKDKGGIDMELPNNFSFLYDFQFEFFKSKMFGGKQRVMSFWLHTQFIESTQVVFSKKDMDKVNKKKSIPQFAVELSFEWGELVPTQQDGDLDRTVQCLKLLTEGRKMTRYYDQAGTGILKKDVYVWYKEEGKGGSFYWCDPGQHVENNDQRIDISTITSIFVGKQDQTFTHLTASHAVEERCFSILAGNKSLHLEAFSERQLSFWLDGIKYLLSSSGNNVIDEDFESLPSEAKSNNNNSDMNGSDHPNITINVASTAGSSSPASPARLSHINKPLPIIPQGSPTPASKLSAPNAAYTPGGSWPGPAPPPRPANFSPSGSLKGVISANAEDRSSDAGTGLASLASAVAGKRAHRRVISIVSKEKKDNGK